MSYDLDIRTRPPFDPGVPLEEMASELLRFPGIARLGTTSFLLDREDAGVHIEIDVGHQDSDEDEYDDEQQLTHANVVYVSIPYPLLERTWPVALKMALHVAGRFGWSVVDLQTETDITAESVPLAIDLERLVAGPSFLGLFIEHLWPRQLWSAAMCFVAGTILGVWVLLALDRPREDFDRYMPYLIIAGAIVVTVMKGTVQAGWRYVRGK